MQELLKHRQLVVTLGLLYLAQGIPMGIAMDALPTLLRQEGSALSAIAFIPLVGLPWVLKFLWAPVVDNYWFKSLGRRRSWIIPMQVIVTFCLLLLAIIGISIETAKWGVTLLAIASLASATQDIATDGMAAEHASGTLLSKINAVQIAGVMGGFFLGGAGMMILTDKLGQHTALLLFASVPAISLFFITLFRQKAKYDEGENGDSPNASLLKTVRRKGAVRLLTLTLLSAVTAVSGFGLAKLFLSDSGWSLAEIGKMGMMGGMVTLFFGCGGGAWLINKIGVWRAFSAGLLCALGSSLLWLSQSTGSISLSIVAVCIVLGSLSSGITSVAIMTAGMHFASTDNQAGTDMTAVQSMRDIGEMACAMMLVSLTSVIGYSGGFGLAAVIALGALLVTIANVRYQEKCKVF
ncbi:RhtX/FptX family siderophore transporter [Proteus vulgaris]|uniref:RhtX/FptX family siderophore transporter n=1 Tax=Proteus TaxID=583 RepID=UPI000D687324|nr:MULTISPECIES: RhtX/FptX family siderophore transporter [Proteus]MBQ0214137.1 RhtX/FptX family siderophore transporter [Proteus vulgaris]MDS0786520.1 RhtX/FptX family siderophore transporter [Proteus vulgaris]NBM53945.1 RhtX/FptX family siderophore transporter [Proteus sp. G2669]